MRPDIRDVAIEAIRADVAAQPREHISTDIVAAYSDDMTLGAEFPPLVVFQEGRDTYWLADGFHRLSAARGVRTKIACEVHKGGRRAAILYSTGANAEHGHRRSIEDKRRAVTKLLTDEEWGKWSDHDIARQVKVSQPFVGRLRADLASGDTNNVISTDRTFTHPKTGKPTVMDTSNIGKPKATEPQAQQEISQGDAPRAAHRRDPGAKPTGWVLPIIGMIDAEMAKLPPPREFVDGLGREHRAVLNAESLEAMAAWFTQSAQAWRERFEGAAAA